jgi:hypothetical protein
MRLDCFFISGGGKAWLCTCLDPIQQFAEFADWRISQLIRRSLPSRPGAPYAYMETCAVECDIEESVVTTVRELVIIRGEQRHKLI